MRNVLLRLVLVLLLLSIAFMGITGLQGGWTSTPAREFVEVARLLYSADRRVGGNEQLCEGTVILSNFLVGSVFLGLGASFLIVAGTLTALAMGYEDVKRADKTVGKPRQIPRKRLRDGCRLFLEMFTLIIALTSFFHLLWGIIVMVHSNCQSHRPTAVSSTAVIMALDVACFNVYCLCTRL
jgi:hypothetical protein